MERYRIFEEYKRGLGALCSFIPAILYLIIILVTGQFTLENLIWVLVTFSPLIVAGFYLDIILNSNIRKYVRQSFLRVIISWIIAFPLARLFGLFLWSGYIKKPIILKDLMIQVPFSIVAGALYGFFFIIAYAYLFKIKSYFTK